MRVLGDLGFQFGLLFWFVVFPTIGLVIRRKWRIVVARREEVRRLLALASEETARAELEAISGYGYGYGYGYGGLPAGVAAGSAYSQSQAPSSHCVVCFSPTTSRCSRCKAIRYCSTKCQIVDWRQGHKDECHPPVNNFQNDEGLSQVMVKQKVNGDDVMNFETEEKESGVRSTSKIPELNHFTHDEPSIGDKPLQDKSGSHDGSSCVLESSEEQNPSFLPNKLKTGFSPTSSKGLFPYELFVKLYNWNKVELQPCGLINCGNSCYANVVLQCLAFTPPLTAYFLQGLHSESCLKKGWCFTCELERLILKAKKGSFPLSPIEILSQVQKIGSHLANGREEDAHEFLKCAVDSMQSICLHEAGVYSSNTGTTKPSSYEEETNLIGLTFGGYLRSKIRCMRCHGKSQHDERIMDLSVEIDGDIETLEEALKRFTETEILDGENKYHCGRCKSYERAKKKLIVLEAPNILSITLKRYRSGNFGKLNKSIKFSEILDFAPYMGEPSDKSPIYRLYGVVVHLDNMNSTFSGHYVCYIRNVRRQWFAIDDSLVEPVTQDSVLGMGAYMLFYSRCSPRAPRSIRDNIIEVISRSKHSDRDHSKASTRIISLRSGNRWTQSVDFGTHQNGSTFSMRPPNFAEVDSSSSDSSSIFSHSDDASSASTDSNHDSSSADDLCDTIFGNSRYSQYNNWKNSSDSDTSTSSISSSPLLYLRRPLLSSSNRCASSESERNIVKDDDTAVPLEIDIPAVVQREAGIHSYPTKRGREATFLRSYSSNVASRKIVYNSSSSRVTTDSERLGWPNSLDYAKSSVHVRKSSSRGAD